LILVDTNVFLETLFARARARESSLFLNRISEGNLAGVVTRFSVHSIEAILKGKPKGELTSFLRGLDQSKGLSIYDTTTTDEVAASLLMDKISRDFDDSLQYYVAKKLAAESIVSFDRDFDGLDVRRLEPKDFVGQSPGGSTSARPGEPSEPEAQRSSKRSQKP
jgi:predicted nucleic acid-binding protein